MQEKILDMTNDLIACKLFVNGLTDEKIQAWVMELVKRNVTSIEFDHAIDTFKTCTYGNFGELWQPIEKLRNANKIDIKRIMNDLVSIGVYREQSEARQKYMRDTFGDNLELRNKVYSLYQDNWEKLNDSKQKPFTLNQIAEEFEKYEMQLKSSGKELIPHKDTLRLN